MKYLLIHATAWMNFKNKIVAKDHVLYNFIYIKYPE